jgi:hypothetical protein
MSALPDFNRATALPVRDPDIHWIETVEAGAQVHFFVYSPAIWQMWTHFTGKTKPCFENHDFCEGGHKEETMRWYGFVYGWHTVRRSRSFLQLTAGAARQWFDQIAPGTPLRGMQITVSRSGQSKQGRMNLSVNKYVNREGDQLGPDCDPKKSLYKMWKVKHVGCAARLSLVTDPADVPSDGDAPECLKTDASALSIKELGSASSTKKRSRKR